MAKKSPKRKRRSLLNQVCNADAAGIDIGSREIMVAVGSDKDDKPVRGFETHNEGLREAVAWLVEMDTRTVAMECTGNYWVTLYDFLQRAGIDVCMVNARYVKGVPGRKTDVQDAQWLQQLHTAGLLRASFVPDQEILSLRYLQRHRDDLVRSGGREIQHMQKVFTEMNVQLHHVLSDIDGLSGRRIIEAIINGERNPEVLADLRHPLCKTPRPEVVRALDGNFRDEFIIVLEQSFVRWKQTQHQVSEVDRQLGEMLARIEADSSAPRKGKGYTLDGNDQQTEEKLPLLATARQASKREPAYDVRTEASRIYGTDLSLIPSVGAGTLSTLLTEVGSRKAFVEKFKNGHHFTSWLGLCPDNRISGNKNLGSKTRKVKSRLAYQLRMGAMTLWRNESELGLYCRRMKSRLGKAEGITATAHKIARIIYSLITTGKVYDDKIAGAATEVRKAKQLKNLQKTAKRLGFQLVAAEAA